MRRGCVADPVPVPAARAARGCSLFFAVPMGYHGRPVACRRAPSAPAISLTWNFGDLPRGDQPVLASCSSARSSTPLTTTAAHAADRLSDGLHHRVPRRAVQERPAADRRPAVLRRFVIRTLTWRMILADNGFVFGHAQGPGPARPGLPLPGHARLGHLRADLQLPAVHDPAAVRGAREDRPAADRGGDRPLRRAALRRSGGSPCRCRCPACSPGRCSSSSRPWATSSTPRSSGRAIRDTTMIGNVIQLMFLDTNDYPAAAALGFVLVAVVMVLVAIYAPRASARGAADRPMSAPRSAGRSSALGCCRSSPRWSCSSCSCPSR